ncbi:hypothetical protein BC332_04143 [Capsicum chinense]|nr:hypothetical protein BC332_04143 [Capsicum chinense]
MIFEALKDDSEVGGMLLLTLRINYDVVNENYDELFVKKNDRILPNLDVKYTNLYFKNLETDISEEHLREKFFVFQSINNLVISKDESETLKDFGFVNFDDLDDARKAVEAMNGSPVNNELHKLFSQCGTITSTKIMQDKKGVSKDFGFTKMTIDQPQYHSAAYKLDGNFMVRSTQNQDLLAYQRQYKYGNQTKPWLHRCEEKYSMPMVSSYSSP